MSKTAGLSSRTLSDSGPSSRTGRSRKSAASGFGEILHKETVRRASEPTRKISTRRTDEPSPDRGRDAAKARDRQVSQDRDPELDRDDVRADGVPQPIDADISPSRIPLESSPTESGAPTPVEREDTPVITTRLVASGPITASAGKAVRRFTLPYAIRRGTFVRVPTFGELGLEAPPAPPATKTPEPPQLDVAEDGLVPPAPQWGQTAGPEPILLQLTAVDSGEVELESSRRQGTVPFLGGVTGTEEVDTPAALGTDGQQALGVSSAAAFEVSDSMSWTDFGPAVSVTEPAANDSPYSMSAELGDMIDAPTLAVSPEVGSANQRNYGSTGAALAATGPDRAEAETVEVIRSTMNRAEIVVDTEAGQVELAITTAGKHVMIEANADTSMSHAISNELEALKNALDRHDLQLVDLAFGGDQSQTGSDAERGAKPSGTEGSEGGDEASSETWVLPSGFRVVA